MPKSRPVAKTRLSRWLLLTIYGACIGLIAAYAYRHPGYNWDMLAYMALVVQKQHKNPDSIHAITYARAKQQLPPATYENLVSGDVRQQRLQDPALFNGLLRFHAIKPLYTETVNLFYKAGFSLSKSTVIPSVLSYILFAGLVLYWLLRWLPFPWAVASALLIMSTNMIIAAAQRSAPDMLSALLLLAVFYCILEKPSLRWCLLLMMLAIFTRLDNIVTCFFVLSYFFLRYRKEKKLRFVHYLLSVSGLIGGYFLVTYIGMRRFDSSLLFYDWFTTQFALSDGLGQSFSLSRYFAQAFSQLLVGIIYNSFALFLLIAILTLYNRGKNLRQLSAEQYFVLVLLGVIAVRFVLFPDLTDRFNIPFYVYFLLLLCKRVHSLTLKTQS